MKQFGQKDMFHVKQNNGSIYDRRIILIKRGYKEIKNSGFVYGKFI